VKAGYSSKTVLRFAGEGHQTVHGAVSNLLFKIEELPHPNYFRQGDNLVYTHRLSLADAIGGTVVEVVTLDNRTLSLGV
jgi:DnaJ family protein B protein 4